MNLNQTPIQKQIESAVTNGKGYYDSPIFNEGSPALTARLLEEKVYWDNYKPFKEDPLGIILRAFAYSWAKGRSSSS